jgi:ribosomal protein L15
MMPRTSASRSIDDIVREAMEGVVKRASVSIARAIAEMAAARLSDELEGGIARARGRGGRGGRGKAGRSARSRSAITRWVADRRARRVPTFVIEATGLKTKKQIVARYGENAAFEKGKPLPAKAKKDGGAA